jgi:hypothetical protein
MAESAFFIKFKCYTNQQKGIVSLKKSSLFQLERFAWLANVKHM